MIALTALLLAAQVVVQDPRLERLDPDTRASVLALVDSARSAGLPVEPLVQRSLEGVMKGAAGARIVIAVRRLAGDLQSARVALGVAASPPELEAGAAALRAGAPPSVLAHLRVARRPPLTMALAVLADLVASGVPVDRAAAAVLTLAPTARDADLLEFRRAVERDIALGTPPAAATAVRLDASARAARPGRP
jgi:hypothetical protein